MQALADPLRNYRLLKQIGVGARSRVFEARDAKTGQLVAVKHVVRESSEDDRFMEQAENEFAVCQALDHPSLRRCLHLHRVRKLMAVKELYLVMELVPGMTLDVARPNRLHTFLRIFKRVAEGLRHMHERGYVHTDLKPINIMIAPNGVLKVIDFGQACRIGHRKERIQGTPDYISPEQVRRLALDQRTDVFNLGATMYWVLTSETYPTEIRGLDSRGGMKLKRSDRVLAPSELNDKIPVSLSRFVLECCSENPADRPPDMARVLARLTTIQKLWEDYLVSMRAQKQGETPPELVPDTEARREDA